MANHKNKLTKFWEELKRRKVIRVILVYATTAFIIMQFANLLETTLNFPAWFDAMVTIILIIGFPIVVILAWIFDITPQGVEVTKSSETRAEKESYGIFSKRYLVFDIIIGVLLFAVFILAYPKIFKSKYGNELEKSIAVLPFRNLSNDSTQIYFCDGFMEELLNNLQQIKNFKVRSRTSSLLYRNTLKSASEIGRELNANYLVEGSIALDERNMKIWIQLIDTKEDVHIWSKDFSKERNLEDIFAVHSEISKQIANQLKITLLPDEIKKIDQIPTNNEEAYDYFLRGKDYGWRSYEKQDYSIAISMYQKAINLDSEFVQAYLGLSDALLQLYWFHYDRSQYPILEAKKAIEKAQILDPENPEIFKALGAYYYRAFLDYSKSLEYINQAIERYPEYSEAIFEKANICRRMGKWEVAENLFKEATEYDPKNTRYLYNLAETYFNLGKFEDAERVYGLIMSMNPTFTRPYWQIVMMYLKQYGNTQRVRTFLDNNSSLIDLQKDPMMVSDLVLIEAIDANYNQAMNLLDNNNFDVIDAQFFYVPFALLKGNVYSYMGEHEKATEFYLKSKSQLEKKLSDFPDDPRLYSSLGIALAGIGEKEAGIKMAKKGTKLMPLEKEAYRGYYRLLDLACVYTITGEDELAIDILTELLAIPGPLSPILIYNDPQWDALHENQSFITLMKNYKVIS